MGDTESGSGLPAEVHRLRTSDHDRPEDRGEKHERFEEKGLKQPWKYGIMLNCDT